MANSAVEKQYKQISPMIMFPGCVARVSLLPAKIGGTHQVLVEFTDLATKEPEHVHADTVTLPQQIKAGVGRGKFWLNYRDGDGKWNRFFERTVADADNTIHPSVEFDWRQ